jgi:predicted RNase H-like HicB family nuclease
LTPQFSSIITKEEKLFVANCPELDITSQGETIELALSNLREAIVLYLEDEDVDYSPPDIDPLDLLG